MPFTQIGTDRMIGIDYAAMREYRLERVREMMDKYGYGVFVTWDAWDMRYLNGGYPTVPCRWAATMISILCRNDDPILCATTVMSPFKLKEYYTWMPEDHVTKDIGGGKMNFTAEAWQPFFNNILRLMKENNVEHLPVALDSCPNPEIVYELFENAGIEVAVPTEELYELRSIKSNDEIACMNISAAIAEAAMYQMQKAIHPAIRECDLTALAVKTQYFHCTDEVAPPNIVSGWRTNPMHNDYTDRLIMAGEMIDVHLDAVSFNGYKTSLGRTFVLGQATQEQKDAYAKALKLMTDAIAVIKPGATTKDIVDIWPKSPSFWGYESMDDVRRCAKGNGIGLMFEEGPFFSCGDGDALIEVELKPGMTLALETWYGPKGADFGASIKETVLVTETGCRLLTKYPVDGIIEIPV